jgi:hypothetical protein
MTGQNTSGPPKASIPLSKAMQQFLPDMWQVYAVALEARKNRPKPPDFFSMSTRQWVDQTTSFEQERRRQTEGTSADRIWSAMIDALLVKLCAGEVVGYGQDEPPFGPWREIPTSAWRQLRITNIARGTASVGPRKLHDIHVIQAPLTDDQDLIPTGAPGRPSLGIEAIHDEFKRRTASGLLEPSLRLQARALVDWYRENYPVRQSPTTRTVENRIRGDYRAVRPRSG